MKISVLINYYNQADFVADSINSVLAIKFPCEYEILVGDDGSSDDTVERIKTFKEKHPDVIKYYVMPRDKTKEYEPIFRASANRLNLVQKATGDYLLFLDGDDFYCDTDFVKEAIQKIEKDSKLVACAFNFQYNFVDKNKHRIGCFRQKQGTLLSKKYVRRYYTPSGAIVFKNIFTDKNIELLKKNGIFDDNVITIFILQYGQLYCFDKVVYTYRQFENSSWNRRNEAEKHLLNAMDFHIISSVAPKFKKELAKRQWGAIKQTYKLKGSFEHLLGDDKYKLYEDWVFKMHDKFISALLKWNHISLWEKLLTVVRYYAIKLKRI